MNVPLVYGVLVSITVVIGFLAVHKLMVWAVNAWEVIQSVEYDD